MCCSICGSSYWQQEYTEVEVGEGSLSLMQLTEPGRLFWTEPKHWLGCFPDGKKFIGFASGPSIMKIPESTVLSQFPSFEQAAVKGSSA